MDSPGSELPLQLLKDGAELCTCASDILSHLSLPSAAPAAAEEPASPQEGGDPILHALFREDKTFEELLEETALPAAELTSRLSMLELDDRIERLPGRSYAMKRQ